MPAPKQFFPTDDEIAAIDPESGPWEVTIAHRQFHYVQNQTEDGEPLGFAYARNGDVVSLLHYDDFVRGLRQGAFVDPSSQAAVEIPEGPGDFAARSDLVEYVKTHKTDDVLAYVGSDPDIAALMIDAENEAKPNNGEPRKGVIAGLQAVIDAYMDPSVPAAPGDGDVDPALTLADHAAAVATGTEPGSVDDPGDEDETGDDEGDDSEEE